MPQDPIIALLQSQGLDPFTKSKQLSGLESATNLTRAAEISGAAFKPFEAQITIGKGVQSILEGDFKATKAETDSSYADIIKSGNYNVPQLAGIDLDTKNQLKESADIFNRILREGTVEESQKALKELRDKFNRISDSSLSTKEKDALRKSYTELVDRVGQINTYKAAKKEADSFFSENSLEERERMLANPNPNQRLSLSIKSKQTRNADILNNLADFESNKVGSRLYNEEDLATFKSTYVKTDDDLYAGMEMQYNYAMKNAVDEKVANYQKQISDLDAQIKQSVNQEEKNSLALQKANINKELNYSKNLSNKLKPYTIEDNYLKQFYPEQYTRKKEREKQEVYRNEMWAQGDQGSVGETLYRSGQQIKSNFLKQVSGLAYLAGANELGYRIKSGAEYAAPPTYFVGKDLNKNNKIDDAEITRDIHGDRVTMSQVSWTDKNGNKTWNLWSPIEQVLPIATDVATTILLSKGVGAVGRGFGLTYGRIGAAAGLSEAGTASFVKNWAPRISTMGVVTSTTFPRFYAEERSNFKNGDTAFKVALMRAGVEGLTETLVPDVNLFSGKVAFGALDPAFAKLGKLDPANLSRLTMQRDVLLGLLPKGALSPTKAAMLMAPAAIRRTLSGASQESIEELGSLVGNYVIDKYASSQNFEVEETNQLTGEAFLDTLVEGFIPSLFISGATSAFSRSAAKKERLDQARWNIANNPEKYKQLIANKVQSDKISKEEGLKQTAAVDSLSKRLDSISDMKNIKNLTNLLDDKELQFNYFNNQLFQEDLLNVDATQLSPEQLKEYEDSLAKTSKEILSTKKLADKYAGLEETDKRAIISKLFDSQAKAAISPDTRLTSLLGIAEQTRQSLLTVPVGDERYQFVSEEYKKFQDKVDENIVSRVNNFKNTLENNPEQLTSLELTMAKETFMPALDRIQGIDAGFTLQDSPLVPEQGPKTYDESVPQLIRSIQDELETRMQLTGDEFQTEVPKNLKNPETKNVQERQLAIAELSEDELSTGELEEGAHDHLNDFQRFVLAAELEEHRNQKEQDPNTTTDLQNDVNAIHNNLYNISTRGLSSENSRAKIIEMNKVAMEVAPSVPEVNNFSATPTAPVVTPSPIVNVPGRRDDVDQDVYSAFIQDLEDLNEVLSNNEMDDEDRKIFVSQKNTAIYNNISNLGSVNEVRSALLALFSNHEAEVEVVFDSIKAGALDVSSLDFISPGRRDLLEQLLTRLSSIEDLSENPTNVANKSEVTNTPDIITSEVLEELIIEEEDPEVVFSDNFEINQDNVNSEIKEVKLRAIDGLYLSMPTVDSVTDNSYDDSTINLGSDIITSYSEDTRSGKSRDMKIRIQSMMGIYKFILSNQDYATVEELRQKKSLNEEEKARLVEVFNRQQIPLHDKSFVKAVLDNPKLLGSGVGSVFVDPKGDLIKFNPQGRPTPNTNGNVFVALLPDSTASPKLKEIRATVTKGKIVTSLIEGTVSGFSKLRPLSQAVGESIKVITTPNGLVIPRRGAQKDYLLKPGSVHLEKENVRNPYTGVNIPTNGNTLQLLVNAFNEGTLPTTIDESIRTNAAAFLEYLSQQINSVYIKGIKEGKQTTGIRFFKKSNLYLCATASQKLIVKYVEVGEDGKNYYRNSQNQQEDLLKMGETSYKLVRDSLVKQNKPYQALVVSKNNEITTKNFNTYTDFIKSPEFGATFLREENRSLSFSSDYEVSDNSTVDVVNDNINVIPEPVIALPVDQPTDQPTQPTGQQPRKVRTRPTLIPDDINPIDPEFFRERLLDNQITEKQNQQAKAWVSNHPIFKNTPFIFDSTISHPEAYAVWSKAGIFLFEGANYAEAYHEAWHEFSQLYLTPEQKVALYAEARSIYGDLSFVELEERLAEDFRAYALSGGVTMPEALKKAKESKSIFKQIWDFISNLFSNKKTIDHYFSRLYKGNLTQFKRNESNQYFTKLYSGKYSYQDSEGVSHTLSFKDSKALLDDLDSIYVSIANNQFKDKGINFVNIVSSGKNANIVYSYMEKSLFNDYEALTKEYEKTNNQSLIPKIDQLVDLLDNFQSAAQFHKLNSTIFEDNIKRQIVSERIEEFEKVNSEFASYEASVNEMSNKQLASQVLVNALRTLPKYENGRMVFHPIYGTTILSDFNTNWNILQRRLSGTNSYTDLYSRVEEIAEEYPQFNQFLQYLPAPDSSIARTSSMNFKNEFFSLFSMPYIEGYTANIKRDEEGNISEVRVFQANSLDSLNIRKKYDLDFSLTSTPYTARNEDTGTFYLNTQKYFGNFPAVPSAPKDQEDYRDYNQALYNMLTPLGFNLSPAAVELFLNEDATIQESRVRLIYEKLSSLSQVKKYIMSPLADLSIEHEVSTPKGKKKVDGENRNISAIIQYEVQANPEYVDDMRYNADQKQIWSVNQHTFMSKVLGVLNDSVLYPTIDSVYEELPHLNPKNNPGVQGSFVLTYLFNNGGNRILDKVGNEFVPRKVELGNLLGIKTSYEGEKTIDANESKKHYVDIIGLTRYGIEEINRLSGKSTTRALVLERKLREHIGLQVGNNEADAFSVYNGVPTDLFNSIILPLIKSEVDVTIKGSSKFPKNEDGTSRLFEEDNSPKLTYFHKIFNAGQRTALLNAFKSPEPGKSLKDIFEGMPEYKDILTRFNFYIRAQANKSKTILGNDYALTTPELMKYHFFSAVSRIEQHKIFFNHPYYYKSPKDIEKRLSAWNAFGSYATLDLQNLEYLTSNKSGLTMYSGRDAFQAYANKTGIKVNPNRANADQISYLVLKDQLVKSVTASKSKVYGKSKEAYTNNKKAAKQDAAAFCTLDFFRKFYALTKSGLTPEMIEEFKRQDAIYKKHLEIKTAPEYEQESLRKELLDLLNQGPFHKFTIKKLQYSGHNKIESGESVPVFHKYSMKPILPSEMVNDTELEGILQKLHASSADYAVFESGTKIAETVESVSLFDAKNRVKTQASPTGVIDMKYLKEQVLVENKEDFNNIFSTQLRKLIYKDLVSEREVELYEEYKNVIESLTNFDKINFLEQLEDKQKLVEFLIREISKKNASESTKDLLQLKADGTLMHTLDSMIDRTIMESAVVSSVRNQVIRQKVPGAQRVQYPVSLIRPSRKLAYYDIQGGKVTKAEVIVSFSKGYYPLLNLISPVDGEPIGELDANGKPFNPHTALTRLNEAIQNPKFRMDNASQLAMMAIRIPGSGYNTIESFEVVEFLPEESGEIILVPDEMVVKSGSDYDIDKLFCYDPHLEQDGTMISTREFQSPEEALATKNAILNKIHENKETIRTFVADKNLLVNELRDLLTEKGFNPDTKLKELYLELQSLKGVEEEELVEAGVTAADLLRLQEKFTSGISETKSKVSDEVKARIKAIRSVLSTASDRELSQEIGYINDTIADIIEENTSLTKQLKSIRGQYTNALLLNMADRMSQPEVFQALITPNEIKRIDAAVEEFGSVSSAATADLTNIINPIYQLYVFSLNTYKNSLGTDAKNNVFHSLLQKTRFYRRDKAATYDYILDANRTEEGYIDFSRVYNVDREPISLLTGEMINAHVDIEKNDGIARIGLNNVITPVVNYVTMAGSRFNDIVNIINRSAGLDEEGKKIKSSILKYSKGESLDSITQDILSRIPEGHIARELITKSITKYGVISRSALKRNVNNKFRSNLTLETAKQNLLEVEDAYHDLARLGLFLELEDQTRDLATVSLSVDYDTFSPQNFESFRSSVVELDKYLKPGTNEYKIFTQEGLNDIIYNSVVSPYQIQQDVLDKFIEVFPISANSKITNKILVEYARLKTANRKLDYDKLSRTFKNDLLYSLFINNVPEVREFETYLDKKNPGNIGSMYLNLKSRLASRGITAENDVFNMVSINSEVDSDYVRTGITQTDLNYSVDILKEEFEKGLNWSHPALDPNNPLDSDLIGDMQGFFRAFAYAGIIGTQLNKKFDSYLPLIPESIYTLPMTDIIDNFVKGLDVTPEEGTTPYITQFINRFNENHPEFRRLDVPPALNYYKDYVLSRPNTVDMSVVRQSELRLEEEKETSTGELASAKEFLSPEVSSVYLKTAAGIVSKYKSPETRSKSLRSQISINPSIFNTGVFVEPVTEEEAVDLVIQKSDNPYEIAQQIVFFDKNFNFESIVGGTKLGVIYDFFLGGKISSDSVRQAYDNRLFNVSNTPGIKDYVGRTNKKDEPYENIDQVALSLSAQSGQEIEVQDIVDFISENPKGLNQFKEKFLEPLRDLQKAGKGLVGTEMTPADARFLVDSYNKATQVQATPELSTFDVTQFSDLESGKLLQESFSKLRELNNNLSKNC
jgi:hypothetical protein